MLERSHVARGLLIAVALALGVAAYWRIVGTQYAVNSSMHTHDQSAYMSNARRAHESGFTYTGDRNRMPLYIWLLALVYAPDMSDDAFFARAKQVNIAVSAVCLLALALAFWRRFSRLYATYSLVVLAFLLFAIKAPYAQAELLFYTVFALAFFLSVESIRQPSWGKSIGVGLLFALAHYAKASALLGVAIYSASFVILFFFERPNRGDRREMIGWLARALTPLAVFTLLLAPYFIESKAKYRHYLYNVSTTFYMWYDSWEEVQIGTLMAGDHRGWPHMAEEDIPSLGKYLAEHSLEDMRDRLDYGLNALLHWACRKADSRFNFGYCQHLAMGGAVAGGGLVALAWRRRLRLSAREWQLAGFIGLFFVGFAMAVFWYQVVTAHTRFILPLLAPALWTFGLIGESDWLRRRRFRFCDRALNPARAAWWLLLWLALFQVLEHAAFRAAEMYGG